MQTDGIKQLGVKYGICRLTVYKATKCNMVYYMYVTHQTKPQSLTYSITCTNTSD